jgi:hypothetical protein
MSIVILLELPGATTAAMLEVGMTASLPRLAELHTQLGTR